MLQRLSTLRRATVHAVDGDVGTVHDFYFDDLRWVLRYVVVDTGGWLTGQRVVLSVMSLMAPDWESGRLPVKLAKEQIRESPRLAAHPGISRALEAQLLTYYGYPFYWAGDALWGFAVEPLTAAARGGPIAAPPADPEGAETHLHSCNEVLGSHIHARDGELGHIDDYLVDAASWAIEAILIDTSNWIGGRSVAIETASIHRVDWVDRSIRVNLSRDTISAAPDFEPESRTRR